MRSLLFFPRRRALIVTASAFASVFAALTVATFASTASAATLEVGSGQTYATPCAAIAKANANDEIDIHAGTYHDTCAIAANQTGLHLKGVGGRPKIDITGIEPNQDKAIYTIAADDVTIENLELTGASISDDDGSNGCGLRIQSSGVLVTGCYIHDNQEGILAGPATDNTGTITITHSEFSGNGIGNGCDNGNGCTHNVYIGHYAKLLFEFNYSHSLAHETIDKGHLLKSRALESDILYNEIAEEGSPSTSLEIDLCNAGLGIVVGNVIEKGMSPGNDDSIDYGEEGAGTGTNELYVAYNTFVDNSKSGGPYIFIDSRLPAGALAAVHDNIFVGGGALPPNLSADNLTSGDPLFADPMDYDYHLQSGSPAIGKAVDAGAAGGTSLTPAFEYVAPTGSVARAAAADLGAFEFGTVMSVDGGAGDDGGNSIDGGGSGSSDDGGATARGDGGALAGGSSADGGASPKASADGGGCSCRTAPSGELPTSGIMALGAAAALLLRRGPRRRGRGQS